jgi:hypothetical protein
MNTFGWSRPFATEYVIGRTYDGLSHNSAYIRAMKSTWIPEKFKPKGVSSEY